MASAMDALAGELLEATALLEGAIFAVRRLMHELVRPLDEAAVAVSPSK